MVPRRLKTLGKHHLPPRSALRFGTPQRLSPTFCFPPGVAKANPRRVVKASRHVQVVKGNPHNKVAKDSRRQVVKANRQTPPGYLLKKLHLNRGSRCSNDGYAH